MMKKLILTLTALSVIALSSFAQWDDSDDGWGDYDDSTSADSMDGWGDGSWDDGSSEWDETTSYSGVDYVRSSRPKFERRAYTRFTGMPYDSATDLITYVEVVDVIVRDEYLGEPYDYQDSLFTRASKWMELQFGEKEAKQMLKKQGMDQSGREGLTIITKGIIPLIVELNESHKENMGRIQFDMELRFKDGRYRYKFNNFIHLEDANTEDTKPIETYMEYYLHAKKNIVANDRILIATDKQMTQLIEDLKDICAHEPFVDDDDW